MYTKVTPLDALYLESVIGDLNIITLNRITDQPLSVRAQCPALGERCGRRRPRKVYSLYEEQQCKILLLKSFACFLFVLLCYSVIIKAIYCILLYNNDVFFFDPME